VTEEDIKNTLRSFVGSLEKKDTERSASFFADDVTWFTNQGKFKGKEE